MTLEIVGYYPYARKMFKLSNGGTIHVLGKYYMRYTDKNTELDFISENYMDMTDEECLRIVQEKLNQDL